MLSRSCSDYVFVWSGFGVAVDSGSSMFRDGFYIEDKPAWSCFRRDWASGFESMGGWKATHAFLPHRVHAISRWRSGTSEDACAELRFHGQAGGCYHHRRPYATEPRWKQFVLTPSMSPIVTPAVNGKPPVTSFPAEPDPERIKSRFNFNPIVGKYHIITQLGTVSVEAFNVSNKSVLVIKIIYGNPPVPSFPAESDQDRIKSSFDSI